MQPSVLLLTLLALTLVGFLLGRRRSIVTAGAARPHSLPKYYGYMIAIWCGIPASIILCFWLVVEDSILTNLMLAQLPEASRDLSVGELSLLVNDIRNFLAGRIGEQDLDPAIVVAAEHYQQLQHASTGALAVVILVLVIAGGALAWRRITPELRARNHVENAIRYFLLACSTLAIFTTVGIVLSVLFEAILFFEAIPISEFLFGLQWSPQTAIRSDQVGSSGAFGAVPLFVGTLLISGIAMLVAVPVGLMSAIFLAEYASPRFRAFGKPVLEILAGIPTVVYGFFAALTVAPFIRTSGDLVGVAISSESALAAGLVMGIMIIPFISSLSDDAIAAVPAAMRDGSYGLGATQSETIRLVIIPAALPGIVAGILLAVSRAIGETMIVVMAAGLAAKLTLNPLESVTTVTVQMVTLLVGDQEFDSPKTLAVFALGLTLFLVTLVLNVIALYVVRKYREQYE